MGPAESGHRGISSFEIGVVGGHAKGVEEIRVGSPKVALTKGAKVSLFLWMVIVVVVLLLFIALFLMFVLSQTIQDMDKPGDRFRPIARMRNRPFLDAVDDVDDWAIPRGYLFLQFYEFEVVQGVMGLVAGWFNRRTRTGILLIRINTKFSHHFGTTYEDGTCVGTSNDSETVCMPTPPSHHVEAFPGASLDELAVRHAESCGLIESKFDVVRHDPPDHHDELEETSRDHTRYIKSLPFWRLRTLYWFLIRMPMMRNRSIAQQLGYPNWRHEFRHDLHTDESPDVAEQETNIRVEGPDQFR